MAAPEGRWAALEKYDLFHEALQASSAANPVRLAVSDAMSVLQDAIAYWVQIAQHTVLMLMGTAVDTACSCCWQDARYNPVRAVLKAVPPRGAQKYDMIQVRHYHSACWPPFLDICCSVSTDLQINKLLFGTK